MVRQLPNKSHRVREPEAIAFAYVHLARQGIERREEPVFDEHVVTGQRLEQAGLAGIGVADERGARLVATPLALIGAMLGDVFEPLLEDTDLAADHPPVRLELRLAGAAETDTAANTRQVRPHPRQPRQQILELRELYLELRFVAARAGRED